MRAILGSYDSELTPAEYSPQLTRRMREAEDMVQKVHAHSSEMEVSVRPLWLCAREEARPGRLYWDSPADPPPSARPPYVRAGGAQGGLWRFHAEGSPVCPPPAPPGPCVQVSGCRVTRAGSVLGAHCPAWAPAHTCHSLRLSAGA